FRATPPAEIYPFPYTTLFRSAMARRGGWRREGSRGRFRYVDARGNRITDPEKLERIRSLVIPPAWKDVWISPRPTAKLQATGVEDRKSTRLNSSHRTISYAVF